MFRDFGHVNNNRTPPSGYGPPQQFQERRQYIPPAQLPPYAIRIGRNVLTKTIDVEAEIADLDFPTPEIDEMDLPFPPVGNPELPTFAMTAEIEEKLANNRLILVSGPTGSGKSTQIPQIRTRMYMEAERTGGPRGMVKLTQPRRMAAYALSERTQDELSKSWGDRADGVVSVQTAEYHTITDQTREIVLTDGIEAARAFDICPNDDPVTLILDEVHERGLNVDLVMARIPELLEKHPNLQIVIMSATFLVDRFKDYVEKKTGIEPAVIEIPVPPHNIDWREAPESDVLTETLKYATLLPEEDGLIFVDGIKQIEEVMDGIYKNLDPELLRNTIVLPAYAELSPAQRARLSADTKARKLIVSTNVAETSLTFPGLGFVIDGGTSLQTYVDDFGKEGLKRHHISQANHRQRGGRCGRVQDGICVLTRPDTKTAFVPFAERPEYDLPEILRIELSRAALRAAAIDLDLGSMNMLDNPLPVNVERAKATLRAVGALDDNNKISPLGIRMNDLPVKPSLARMVREAVSYYSPETTTYMAAIAASVEAGGLQSFKIGSGKAWKELTEEKKSDLLAQLDIYIAVKDMSDIELRRLNLNPYHVRRAQETFQKIVKKTRAFSGDLVPPTEEQREELLECIYTGLVDNMFRYSSKRKFVPTDPSNGTEERKVSNRSIVKPSRKGTPLVMARPYATETKKKVRVPGEKREAKNQDGSQKRVKPRDGEPQKPKRETIREIVPIILQVTVVDQEKLGAVVTRHALGQWEDRDIVWRSDRKGANGKPMRKQQRHLYGLDLGEPREVPAEPSDEVRRAIIAHALEAPGSTQRAIRAIKTETERLQHLTAIPVAITDDTLKRWIDEATPTNVTDPSSIDYLLREYLCKQGIIKEESKYHLTIDDFVEPATQEKIINRAVPTIQVAGSTWQLTYQNGVPVATDYDLATVLGLKKPIKLPDGREVTYTYVYGSKKKNYTLQGLRAKIAEDAHKEEDVIAQQERRRRKAEKLEERRRLARAKRG